MIVAGPRWVVPRVKVIVQVNTHVWPGTATPLLSAPTVAPGTYTRGAMLKPACEHGSAENGTAPPPGHCGYGAGKAALTVTVRVLDFRSYVVVKVGEGSAVTSGVETCRQLRLR